MAALCRHCFEAESIKRLDIVGSCLREREGGKESRHRTIVSEVASERQIQFLLVRVRVRMLERWSRR